MNSMRVIVGGVELRGVVGVMVIVLSSVSSDYFDFLPLSPRYMSDQKFSNPFVRTFPRRYSTA
jgi:hypothetical protein